MEIQKILDLTRFKMSDLKLEMKSYRAGSVATRVLLFRSSVHPNAFKFVPNFDFGEEINPSPGSLKNSSSVKTLIFGSSDRSKTEKTQNWILLRQKDAP